MENNTQQYNEYIASLFAPQDAALTEAIAEMKRENVPGINVSATEGKLLQVLALMVGAKRILEIGTLGGYSGIHFARALPEDGKLVTLELDAHHAEVARRNFEHAEIAHKVEIRVGPAAQTLREIAAADEPPFDVVFIDADKDGYQEYLELSLPLLRDGGLILADNTLGRALDAHADNGISRYNNAVAAHPNLVSIIIPVLRGRGGIDGLLVSIKTGANP
jgi:predicted O-methyltransferase YrrM